MNVKTIVTAVSLLAVGPLFAQQGNPAGMMPGNVEAKPGTPAPGQYNPQDRLFIQLAGMGNLGEADAGRLADTRASHPGVKSFARRMVAEHSSTNAKLADIAKQRNLSLPGEPQPDQKAVKTHLETLNGAAFDQAYLRTQLIDHQKTVQLLEWEISNGQHAALQRLAMDTLPAVVEHLRMVQALLAETTGAPAQGLAASQDGAPPPR